MAIGGLKTLMPPSPNRMAPVPFHRCDCRPHPHYEGTPIHFLAVFPLMAIPKSLAGRVRGHAQRQRSVGHRLQAWSRVPKIYPPRGWRGSEGKEYSALLSQLRTAISPGCAFKNPGSAHDHDADHLTCSLRPWKRLYASRSKSIQQRLGHHVVETPANPHHQPSQERATQARRQRLTFPSGRARPDSCNVS